MTSSKVRILFLAAEPMNTDRLRLNQEIRDIEQELHTAPKGRSFNLISQWAVRPKDLVGALLRHRPTIVHFSGHGLQGKLAFEDESGLTKFVEGRHLADLLVAFSDTIRLVVLNACFSSDFFNLTNVIDYTVGTSAALSDSAAIRFSACFYQALAFGHSVPTSYEIAKRQLSLEELPDSDVFTLLVREGVNTSEPFVKPRSRVAPVKKPATTMTNVSSRNEADSFSSAPSRGSAGMDTYNSTVINEVQAKGVRGMPSQVPDAIRESLERFRADHPNPRKVAFLMMRFGKTKAHRDIVAGIKSALDPLGIAVVRADDKEYHADLFPNVLTYVYGCGFGIAVFECIESEEFNPNVALEVGYMFALRKEVCLLKDKTLKTLQADLVGKLYRVFDPLDSVETIPVELARWLSDKALT